MTPIIVFAVIAGLPVFNALVLRVSAIFLFISIAVGNMLVLYLGDDVILAVNAFSKGEQVPLITQLVLLFLPVALTIIVLRKSLATSRLFLHLLPLIGCGLTLMVLALPLLPSTLQEQIISLPFGQVFNNSQDLIVGITAVMILLLTWRGYRHKNDKHSKTKHH